MRRTGLFLLIGVPLIVLAFLVLAWLTGARAEPRLPAGVTCADVRAKVAEHGRIYAYAWARLHGYSKAEIEQAKRCLVIRPDQAR